MKSSITLEQVFCLLQNLLFSYEKSLTIKMNQILLVGALQFMTRRGFTVQSSQSESAASEDWQDSPSR